VLAPDADEARETDPALRLDGGIEGIVDQADNIPTTTTTSLIGPAKTARTSRDARTSRTQLSQLPKSQKWFAQRRRGVSVAQSVPQFRHGLRFP
jgi:hypothetical protein